MKITIDHPASSYGQPVILDDNGRLMDYGSGIKLARKKLGWSARELAGKLGVSLRTVQGWEQRKTPAASSLLMLARLLGQESVGL